MEESLRIINLVLVLIVLTGCVNREGSQFIESAIPMEISIIGEITNINNSYVFGPKGFGEYYAKVLKPLLQNSDEKTGFSCFYQILGYNQISRDEYVFVIDSQTDLANSINKSDTPKISIVFISPNYIKILHKFYEVPNNEYFFEFSKYFSTNTRERTFSFLDTTRKLIGTIKIDTDTYSQIDFSAISVDIDSLNYFDVVNDYVIFSTEYKILKYHFNRNYKEEINSFMWYIFGDDGVLYVNRTEIFDPTENNNEYFGLNLNIFDNSIIRPLLLFHNRLFYLRKSNKSQIGLDGMELCSIDLKNRKLYRYYTSSIINSIIILE